MKYTGNHRSRVALIAAALLSLQSGSALADESNTGTDSFSSSALMDNNDLASSRGGDTKTILNISSINGSVEGNTVNGGTTGDNMISEGSLGFNGIGTVFQNTGNNVLLQSSTVVNLTVCGGSC